MLGKSSVLMMLLIVASSLVGISSIYIPANVETQPQQQPQPLLKEPSMQIPRAGQALSDAQFLDRMVPKIIQRIDGKVLAEKILPHLSVGVTMFDNYGAPVKVKVDPLAPNSYHMAEARCPPGSRVMGGGGQIDPIEGNAIVMMGPIPTQRFVMVAEMSEPGGDLLAYATCLGEAKVGLK